MSSVFTEPRLFVRALPRSRAGVLRLGLMLLALLGVAWGLRASAQSGSPASPTGVTAQAIGMANLRTAPTTDGELLGEIVAGNLYPVIGRSEFVPWVLLGQPNDAQPLGWVFRDLVVLTGDLAAVPFTEAPIGTGSAPPQAVPTATLMTLATPGSPQAPAFDAPPSPPPGVTLEANSAGALVSTPASAPSGVASAPSFGVSGTVLGEINIRYGPGVDYPRLGVARAGEVLDLIAYHVALPWVAIRYPASPTGEAWVAVDLLEVNGDITTLPPVSQVTFALPTLTPTPSMLLQPTVLGQAAPVPLSPEFAGLANTLYTMMLTAGFDPATSTVGGLFLMDVQTGEAVAFGDTLAFSGMSVNKIAILTQYFGTLDAPPNNEQAFTVAEAMVCSENISSNEMLASIGGGSPYRGAEQVSAFMQQLGLNNSFIFTPFANDPFITPEAPLTRTTDADQASTQPDPFNQITVSDVGNLLHSVHQCAYDESGPLLDNFDGDFTPTECRQILNVMTYNRIGTLIEVGVPADVPVAHKHGWINDTHGDAAIVFSPGGTYILVVALHAPQWLNFAVSAPLIEEISRTVYNHYNPDAPLAAVRTPEGIGDLAACNASLLGSPVIDNLMNPTFGQDTGSALG